MHLPKEDTIHRGGYYGGGRRATRDQYRRRNGPRAERPWEVFAPHRALSIRWPSTLAGGRAWASRNRPGGRRRRERRAPTAGGRGQSPRGTGSRGRVVMSPRGPAGSGEPGGCRPYRPEGSHLRKSLRSQAIRALARAGRPVYDRRFSTGSEHVRALFAREPGFATPKVNVRVVVLHDGRLLLVSEPEDEALAHPRRPSPGKASPRAPPSARASDGLRLGRAYRAEAHHTAQGIMPG